MYLIKTPWLLKKFYPKQLTWNKTKADKIIYLTFDDGPIPDVTPFVLKTLKEFNAKATFFCIGDNIDKHPEIFKQIIRDGHAVGNHTYNHLKGWKTEDQNYLANFIKCHQLTKTNIFRPPYGRIKKSQIKLLTTEFYKLTKSKENLNIIMWDVLSGDFDVNLAPEKCFKNVINNSENGSIVVFHDSLKAWDRLEYALPKVIKFFTEKGYQFKSL